MTLAANLSNVDLVEGQLNAYNAQDLEAFCAFYADDAVLAVYNGDVLAQGLDAIRARHAKLFADFPQNKAEVLYRMVLGPNVIDHEAVLRAPQGDSFEVGTIYSFAGGKIARVDFVK